ncbi:ESX secretion-associated protein EspG [Mycobacteroides chelonae]|uniref:ESX secretion-associated protein EspG n=1 Tax=Mycobacteroides chelonae TaxID=1774 RepID=UPI000D6A5221
MKSDRSSNIVGTIDLLDLQFACESYGLESTPFPFRFTKPVGAVDESLARTVSERFNNGDLTIFREWAASYVFSDIRVECHAQTLTGGNPHLRVLATRAGKLGFIARQLPDIDAVEVRQVRPTEIGSLMAQEVPLRTPGKHSKVRISGYTLPPVSDRDEDSGIQDSVSSADYLPEISKSAVSALGTIQSHYLPPKDWGVSLNKTAIVWLKVDGDGDYLVERDFTAAYPATISALTHRIDREISDDIQVIRTYRGQQ